LCALEALGPLGHGEVQVGPEVGVGVVEVGEVFVSGDGKAELGGDEAPIAGPLEVAAVVGVAVLPVGGVELVFVEGGEGAEAGPGLGVGRAGEDEAVVEEDGAYGGTTPSPRTFVRSIQMIHLRYGLRWWCCRVAENLPQGVKA